MIESVALGWIGTAASLSSKPLMTIGLATCLFVCVNAAWMAIAAAIRSYRRRALAQARIKALSEEIDEIRRQHFTQRRDQQSWQGWRKFCVIRKVRECDGCHSFYFNACDGKPLASFHPGQYLTFSLPVPDEEKPLVRCYSLSDSPGKPYYRCTIKTVPPAGEGLPAGRASRLFNERIDVGDVVDVKPPRGKFWLDIEKPGPVVLLAGGVGITPVLSMMNAILDRGFTRETHLFLGVRNSQHHLFRNHLEPFRQQRHGSVHVHVCYSRPLPDDVLGRDFDFEGRITVELLGHVLSSDDYDYFMCGPTPFMDSLKTGLEQQGVPRERIHREAFGGSTQTAKPRRSWNTSERADSCQEIRNEAPVTFSASGRQLLWDESYENLLDLAEANGIAVDSGCRAGSCGTCALPVKSGTVNYPSPPDLEPENGMCLPCVCTPLGPVVLDA